MPDLEMVNRTEEYDGHKVGQYALNHTSGEICFISWKTLFRKHNSYAFSSPLLERIDASKIFIVDNDTREVYLFKKSDYKDGPVVKTERGFQHTLPRTEAINSWDSLDDILAE